MVITKLEAANLAVYHSENLMHLTRLRKKARDFLAQPIYPEIGMGAMTYIDDESRHC